MAQRHNNVINLGMARRQLAEYDEESKVTKITIPLAPISINSLYSFYSGRKILTKTGRRWRDNIDPILAGIRVNYTEAVGVALQCWPKANRPYDIDNCAKSILDALERNLIIANDVQVRYLAMTKHDKDKSKPGGEIWIDIWPYDDRS